MEMVNLKINNVPCKAPAGATILEAAHEIGITIPTLCYLKEIQRVNGACRVCVVEVKGAKNLLPACVYPVSEGMEVFTNTPKVQAARKTNLELILSTHNQDCMSCVRSGDCELLRLCKQYGVDKSNSFEGVLPERQDDYSAPHLLKDNSKCIICRRCISTCAENQGVGVINVVERGFNTHIACAFEGKLVDSTCIGCGQCINVCPTGALVERDDTDKVWAALGDPTRHVIVQTAPSVRAALGEEFGLPIGTNVQGKMVAALRRLGFDGVFDTDFAADMTIMEEATEFLHRMKEGGPLPLITSCSPGWVRYCETFHPDFIPNLSSCKSPQQMFGALSKTYYAQKMGLDPRDIYCVSVMPCTAKKMEISRPDECAAGEGIPDVDVSITTRELARMINGEGWLACAPDTCRLQVVAMENWTHGDPYWLPVKPSPNLPNDQAIRLYPSLCFFEATKVSVGRGTYYPFQVLGFPDPKYGDFSFTPTSLPGFDTNPLQKDKRCYGVDLREYPFEGGLTLRFFLAFYEKAGKDQAFFFARPRWFDLLAGTKQLRLQIIKGLTEEEIRATWQPGLERYKAMRKKYLLYPDYPTAS